MIFLFSIILISGSALGQTNISTIEGMIKNNQTKTISIGDSLVHITEAGGFLFQTELTAPRLFLVAYQDRQFEIFVEPGEKMEMAFDADNIGNSIKFKGNSPETNTCLFEIADLYVRNRGYFQTGSGEWKNLYSRDEQGFLLELDSLKTVFLKPLDELAGNGKNVNAAFLFQRRKGLDFTFDWMILQYPQFHNRFTGEQVSLTKKTKEYLESIDLDNPDFTGIDEYVDLGTALLHGKIQKEFLSGSDVEHSDNRWLKAAFNVIEKTFVNQKVIDFWRYQSLKNHIDNNGVKHIAPFLELFNRYCDSEELKQNINSLYRKEVEQRRDHPVFTYKTIDGFNLDAHVFIPPGLQNGENRPAIIYFHGGSWSEGKPDWQFGYSEYGFVAVSVEYRTYDRYGKLPFEQIADAKSAIRWMRQHAERLHIDPDKIIASGNSAGGHLALCTAMLDTLDEPGEDRAVSSKPNALILTSAVYDVSEGVWFDYLVDDKNTLKAISPLRQIKADLPPMLIFHGTADHYSSPYRYCRQFVADMKKAGNKIDFYPIQDKGHFLWNYGEYWQTAAKAKKEFLTKIGYIR